MELAVPALGTKTPTPPGVTEETGVTLAPMGEGMAEARPALAGEEAGRDRVMGGVALLATAEVFKRGLGVDMRTGRSTR